MDIQTISNMNIDNIHEQIGVSLLKKEMKSETESLNTLFSSLKDAGIGQKIDLFA